MAKRIAVLSTKGGSTKTTTAVNVAASLAARGYRVAAVDADGPQHHAASWIEGSEDDLLKGISVERGPSKEALVAALKMLDQTHDFVVVDVIGVDADVLSVAAAAADLCLVPMATSGLDADGAVNTIERIHQVEAEKGITIDAAVLMSRTKPSTRLYKILRKRIAAAGAPLLTSSVQDRIIHPESEVLKTVPALLEPEGAAALEVEVLVNEILRRIGAPMKAAKQAAKAGKAKKETA